MKMYESKVTDNTAVLKLDSPALERKYLEVLSSKVISPDSIKLICHSYMVDTPFCHRVTNKAKLVYSTVRLTDDGTVFPVVFFSHKGCKEDSSCFWVTHINEVVIPYWRVNKRISLISAHRLLSAYYVVGFNPTLLSACNF